MRRPLFLIAALAATVAVVAVRLAPAAIADARVSQITHGELRIADTVGTVWNARGMLVAGGTQIPVAWRIDALPLLRGELVVHVVPAVGAVGAAGSPHVDIVIGNGRVALRNADVTMPASLVSAAAGAKAAWAVGGDIDVSAASLDWSPPTNRGDARIRWRAAHLIPPAGAAPLDLGEVSLALGADGDRLSGPLSNVGGDLALRGDIALRAGSGIALSLVLTPRRADNRELVQALAMIGAPSGDGWRVDWRWPPQ